MSQEPQSTPEPQSAQKPQSQESQSVQEPQPAKEPQPAPAKQDKARLRKPRATDQNVKSSRGRLAPTGFLFISLPFPFAFSFRVFFFSPKLRWILSTIKFSRSIFVLM